MLSVAQRLSTCLAVVAALGVVGCVGSTDDASNAAGSDFDDRAAPDFETWRKIRAGRQAKLDEFLARNQDGLNAFLYGPVGAAGVPTALLRNFPAVFPDIWGAPSENFGPQGLFKDPFRPESTLPLGFTTFTAANGVELAPNTCAACHVGRVIGPDGAVIPLLGAPNTLFNQLRSAIEDTVRDPRYLAAFGENALTVGFRDKVLQRRQLIDATLGGFTYSLQRFPNAPDLHNRAKPGYLDAIGVALPILTVPEIFDPALAAGIIVAVLPPAPAQIDIVSVWRQSARSLAQWDGSFGGPLYRNLAAELGVVGDPALVNFQNAKATATFTQGLPPPPYPFDVDMTLADRGEDLYKRYCETCHRDNNTTIFPASATRTDPNRTQTFQAEGRRRLIATLRQICVEPASCNLTDEQILRDGDVTGRGYVAAPLDGIWARAPYLHNGSVPTLRQLLVPSTRPATFVRGSLRYDQVNVGFVSDSSAAGEPYTHVFDTREAGAANTGHDTAELNGIDWSRRPRDLAALLEYMKTL